jgi:hypothetical protein
MLHDTKRRGARLNYCFAEVSLERAGMIAVADLGCGSGVRLVTLDGQHL